MSDISKEQVLAAYRQVPQIVRDAFNAEATTQLVVEIQKQYQLHLDVAGRIGKNLGYLLLGLMTPANFVADLQGMGLPKEIIDELMREINQKIFVPLREAMRKGEGPVGEKKNAAAPSYASQSVPAAPQPSTPRMSTPSVPPRVPVGFNTQPASRPTPLPRPVMPLATKPLMDPERELPSGAPLPQVSGPVEPAPITPSIGAPLPPKVAMPRPITPFSRPNSVPVTPQRPVSPAQPFGVARPQTPPANLPGTIPLKPVPPPSNAAPGSDPYREPIE